VTVQLSQLRWPRQLKQTRQLSYLMIRDKAELLRKTSPDRGLCGIGSGGSDVHPLTSEAFAELPDLPDLIRKT
jgi:hypothetical protein